jgi:single-strand DNA-binding protein
MANSFIMVKGNLTRDPEYKNVAGKELVSFRVAVNETFGSGKEETFYIDVDAWEGNAKYAQAVVLAKGDRVTVDGRLRQRDWTDKNGVARVSYSITSNTFSKLVKPARSNGATSREDSEELVSVSTEDVEF